MREAIRRLAFAAVLAIAVLVALPGQADAQHYYGGGYGHYYGHSFYGPGFYGHPYYGYGGYGYGYGGYGYRGYGYRNERHDYGWVRIEASPKDSRDQIRVYVDEALAGVVDDFDGIFQRLNLAPGSYLIEIRLAGYRPFRETIMISPRSSFHIRGELVPLADDDDDAESDLMVTSN